MLSEIVPILSHTLFEVPFVDKQNLLSMPTHNLQSMGVPIEPLSALDVPVQVFFRLWDVDQIRAFCYQMPLETVWTSDGCRGKVHVIKNLVLDLFVQLMDIRIQHDLLKEHRLLQEVKRTILDGMGISCVCLLGYELVLPEVLRCEDMRGECFNAQLHFPLNNIEESLVCRPCRADDLVLRVPLFFDRIR